MDTNTILLIGLGVVFVLAAVGIWLANKTDWLAGTILPIFDPPTYIWFNLCATCPIGPELPCLIGCNVCLCNILTHFTLDFRLAHSIFRTLLLAHQSNRMIMIKLLWPVPKKQALNNKFRVKSFSQLRLGFLLPLCYRIKPLFLRFLT